jgi:hypothetical protein
LSDPVLAYQNVNVVGHNDEAVELKAALFPVTKDGVHHEIGVCGALEYASACVSDRSDCEGLRFDANPLRGMGGHISGAKALSWAHRRCPG